MEGRTYTRSKFLKITVLTWIFPVTNCSTLQNNILIKSKFRKRSPLSKTKVNVQQERSPDSSHEVISKNASAKKMIAGRLPEKTGAMRTLSCLM